MRYTAIIAALALSGCAVSNYQLAVMPRDSGTIYTGTADNIGGREGHITITIAGKTYSGTWVETQPAYTTGWVSGGVGWGWGRHGFGALGTTVTMDNPQGGGAKALLTAQDGTGLRCDFQSGYDRGGGVCRDDRGREYDVQFRKVSG